MLARTQSSRNMHMWLVTLKQLQKSRITLAHPLPVHPLKLAFKKLLPTIVKEESAFGHESTLSPACWPLKQSDFSFPPTLPLKSWLLSSQILLWVTVSQIGSCGLDAMPAPRLGFKSPFTFLILRVPPCGTAL